MSSIRLHRSKYLGVNADHIAPCALVCAAILVANLPAVLHIVSTNPLLINANLAPPSFGWLPGLPYIDPNAGYNTQAMGHLVALDWLHGHIPWWNNYEGIGAPLAGEMQSGALFPLTIVLALHQGMLLLQMSLEIVSGVSTYFLVRTLGVGRTLSTTAGFAFGVCGTFAWFAYAPIRPVALLPLCLLGVERSITAARNRQAGGWYLLAIALALSLLAGFPETAFIDGLFVAWWSVLRIGGVGRPFWPRLVTKLITGAITGLALAAPLLIAFADYLPYASVGAHNGSIGYASLPSAGLSQIILPYSLGPIFAFHSTASGTDVIRDLWGNVGGYLTITLIAGSLVGLVGRHHRILRLGLGTWVAICLLQTFGFAPVVHTMAIVPGIRDTAFYRYSAPSWELAVVLLAGLGLDDISRLLTRRRVLIASAVLTGLLSIWATVTVWPLLTTAAGTTNSASAHRHAYAVGSFLMGVLLLGLLTIGGVVATSRTRTAPASTNDQYQRQRNERMRRRGRMLMAGIVAAESGLLLGFTYLSAPPPTVLQAGSASWLQANLGFYRFVTLGPIQPNYGSYFGIGEANVNDLPTPKAWTSYIAKHLDGNAPANSFTSLARVDPAGPTPAEELNANLAAYEAVGVRYVVESANGQDALGKPFPGPGSPPWPRGPRQVYGDGFAEIWQLPAAAPVFSLVPEQPNKGGSSRSSDTACTVRTTGWDQAVVRCSHPTTLIRRVQYLPGWTASIQGRSYPVKEDRRGPQGLFQEVSVPPGTAVVRFAYLPPHEFYAGGVALLAAIWLLSSWIAVVVRRRTRHRKESGAHPPT